MDSRRVGDPVMRDEPKTNISRYGLPLGRACFWSLVLSLTL